VPQPFAEPLHHGPPRRARATLGLEDGRSQASCEARIEGPRHTTIPAIIAIVTGLFLWAMAPVLDVIHSAHETLGRLGLGGDTVLQQPPRHAGECRARDAVVQARYRRWRGQGVAGCRPPSAPQCAAGGVTPRVGIVGICVARDDVVHALFAHVFSGEGDTAWITRVFAHRRQVARAAEWVIDVFEQDDTGIGRQSPPIAVELPGFAPDWCQAQRCRLPWGRPSGWHRIETCDGVCFGAGSVHAGSLLIAGLLGVLLENVRSESHGRVWLS
jgi:hypothetical protein